MYLNEQIKTLEASVPAQTRQRYLQGRDEFISAALANSQKALDMNQYHTNYYKSRAKVGLYLSVIDATYYQDVVTTLLKVSQLAPTDAKIIYNLGIIYSTIGKNEEARVAFQKAIDLKPDYEEARDKLASLSDTSEKK